MECKSTATRQPGRLNVPRNSKQQYTREKQRHESNKKTSQTGDDQIGTEKEVDDRRNRVYNLSLASQKLMTKKYVTVDPALKNFEAQTSGRRSCTWSRTGDPKIVGYITVYGKEIYKSGPDCTHRCINYTQRWMQSWRRLHLTAPDPGCSLEWWLHLTAPTRQGCGKLQLRMW